MTLKFLDLFSVNSPGDGQQDAKGSQGGGQVPSAGSGNGADTSKPTKPDGPPDLDELWRDFNDRLGGIFGGKSNPKSDAGPSIKPSPTRVNAGDILPPSERNRPAGSGQKQPSLQFNYRLNSQAGIPLIVAGLLLLWLCSGFFIIQEGQAGVVMTFGKYDYSAKPGIHWHFPWPIQSAETINVSGVRTVEVGRPLLIKASNQKESSMLTQDNNIVDVPFSVQYRLKDPTEYAFTNRNPDAAVIQAGEVAVREVVARNPINQVLYEGREKIAIDIAGSIQKILDGYQTGIDVVSVTLGNVQPPEQAQAAFDDALKAKAEEDRLKSEGQAYADDIIPRAKGAASRLIQEAEGYKSRVISSADGDASRFKQVYAEYAKAPQVTRDRMYIDTMRDVYSNVTKILVDTTKNSSLLYLPLDKLVAQVTTESSHSVASQAPASDSATPSLPSGPVVVGQPAAANPAASTTSAPIPAPNTTVDKRESLRSRDRDSR